MAEFPGIIGYVPKPGKAGKGPATYKAAGSRVKAQSIEARKQKKAQRDNVAKKVKKISTKIMGLRKKGVPGPAAKNRY